MIASNKELTNEFKMRVAYLGIVSQALAINGFFTYTDMYIYSLQIRIHCDSIHEVCQAYNLLSIYKSTWKEREVTTHKRNDGSKYYVIELNF